MQENIDHTFAKSRVLVGKVTGDMVRVILNGQSTDLLAINQNVFVTSLEIFGRLRKLSTSSDIIGPLRKIFTPSG